MAAHAIDPAILDALGLDAGQTTMASHGGSGFSSTFRLSTTVDGQPRDYFVKTSSGNDAELMFRGEHASLNAIHDAVPNFCSRSHAHGPLAAAPGGFFLATDFLHLGPGPGPGPGSGLSLAAKLARLHTTPAPVPEGHNRPMFGFPVPTCCGDTVQDNAWTARWADFYADHRLRAVLRACVRNNGPDPDLAAAVEAVAVRVVPRLLGDAGIGHVTPVVVHGDLWSGNHAQGRIGAGAGPEDVVFDQSAVYGHSEYELGIMRMFGGFGPAFWSEYDRLVPRAEPKAEGEDRVLLYELVSDVNGGMPTDAILTSVPRYHHLNHFAIFGGDYRGGAMAIIKKLMAKYGS